MSDAWCDPDDCSDALRDAAEIIRRAEWRGYADGMGDARVGRARPRARSVVRPGGRGPR